MRRSEEHGIDQRIDPAINADIVRGVIDVRLRDAYAFLIGLTEILRRYLSRPIPMLTHGYDYVDFRATLASDATYRRDRANELHPTARGFAAVTEKLAAASTRARRDS